jgi:hypothetical protein
MTGLDYTEPPEHGQTGEAMHLTGVNPRVVRAVPATMAAMLHSLRHDLRYAFRLLRRSPGFAAASILTLALSIGANAAIFSAVQGVLISPLPYPEPERLVRLFEEAPTTPHFRAASAGAAYLPAHRATRIHAATAIRAAR